MKSKQDCFSVRGTNRWPVVLMLCSVGSGGYQSSVTLYCSMYEKHVSMVLLRAWVLNVTHRDVTHVTQRITTEYLWEILLCA